MEKVANNLDLLLIAEGPQPGDSRKYMPKLAIKMEKS
jgi:hypothetical protein